MERMLSKLHEAGAKAVLIGDAEQLQPIEAGTAFRAIAERAGYQELTGIRRQQELWQREASREFARGESGRALERYEAHGAIHFAETRAQAKAALIGEWSEYHAAQGAGKSTLILAHTRADVAELNRRTREVLQGHGELGGEVKVVTWRELMREDGIIAVERGERAFAPGDRVMFLKNDRELRVKNGSLGRVVEVGRDSMRVMLDGKARREVSFNLRDYGAVEYGYAATVHKSQRATVDRVFVLATPGMDRHLAYVGMTRHRDAAALYAARDDFGDFAALKHRLSRAREKDSTLDYAERRGLETTRAQSAGKEPIRQRQERAQTPDTRTPTMKQPERDPVERFKEAQREFIGVAGRFDLDPVAKARAAELREEMKRASQEITKDPARMREAERAGIASQVKSLARQADRERGRDKGRGVEKDEGLER
jgi:Ti-type conjugative transfer relaxase TraA